MLRVRDLLELDNLGLELLAGEEGLDRPVRWAHVAEIEDAPNWLDGSEILLTTGLGIPAGPARQVEYLEHLAAVPASALGIGNRAPELTKEMLDRANRLKFPVLHVAEEVPYASIVQFVAAMNGDTAQSRIANHLLILDSLRSRIDGSMSLRSLFERLSARVNYKLYVIDSLGHSALPELDGLPKDLVAYLPEIAADRPRFPKGYAVDVPLESRSGIHLVAINEEGEGAGLNAVRHIATVAAVELSNLHRRRAETISAYGPLFADVLSGAAGERSAESLAELGFESTAPMILAAASPAAGEEGDLAEIYHQFLDQGARILVLPRTGHSLFLLHATDTSLLEPALRAARAYAGLSRPLTDAEALPVARLQATWAMRWAPVTNAGAISEFEESGGWMTWLPHDVGSLESLVKAKLRPLMDYDEENSTSLTETLRVYFQTDRNLVRTAQTLHIHKHTLQYRLRRIREISGISMSSTKDIAELWMVFQVEQLLQT